MLSEAERRRLAAIESDLRAEDPEFVHRFIVAGASPVVRSWRGPAALAAALAAVTTAGLGLYFLTFVVVVIVAIATVLRPDPDPQDPPP